MKFVLEIIEWKGSVGPIWSLLLNAFEWKRTSNIDNTKIVILFGFSKSKSISYDDFEK